MDHHNRRPLTLVDPQLDRAPDWRDEALCAQVDPELFFPEKGGATADAKAVCFACRVRQECLQWALDNHIRFGVWGGKSENQRKAMLAGQDAQESA